ncbi:uncharacterized protein LOC108118398 [Drosophila eugracilis]|uniref:uncharacterized protein LOC108118398 n=1 Tax=Drosophila eugracilis TaxID=29029 RepID=UPI001BDA138B|nr:uncharacterized protein LOC108118398 [Drosophila eugracilis]
MRKKNINCDWTAEFPLKSNIAPIYRKQPLRSVCLYPGHRTWRVRNQLEIQQLAKRIGCHPEDIDGFLFKLSLWNYNRLLNPKDCSWNSCNVPLCYPYACNWYMDIFDHRGNLRDTNDPKTIRSLLPLVLNFLDGLSPVACTAHIDGQQAKRHSNFSAFSLESSDWSFGNQSVPILEKDLITHYKPVLSESKLDAESQKKLSGRKRKKNLGRQTIFLNDELAYTFAMPDDIVEYIMQHIGRHHHTKGSYIGPIADLRTVRLRKLIKSLVERKGAHITERDLNKAIKMVDLEGKHGKQNAKDISKLYNSIVQRSELPYGHVFGKFRGNYPKVPRGSKLPRRYLGDQVPILFHEPYDPKKRWTWQRRHPKQTRLNTSYRFSSTRIKRYLRASLKDQKDEQAKRFSIHSTISEKGKNVTKESLDSLFGSPKYQSKVKLNTGNIF